ncbi:MAG: SGNH/GDSL hydrolase family protein [Massiliimalia sp.]|jgi:lysophospholipase L1-like esterase
MYHEKIPSIKNIHKAVAIGDSITFGMNASSPEKCWASLAVSMLSEYSGHTIQLVNRGICANILSIETPAYEYCAKPAGLERLEQDIIKENPDLLFIAFGLNDSRGGTHIKIFERDYQCMIDQIRSRISPVIVALNLYYMHEEFYSSCEHWDYSNYAVAEEFNQMIRQLSEENHLIYADVFHAMEGADWTVSADQCHPNDLGHRLIANRVFEAVVKHVRF